ncbi:MAG: UDP-3-O-acyl-N-acetylglucosamine deacetylase [Candidatus Binatia bacterium]
MNRTILIVDDDASVRDSIGDVLRDEGFAVETASDGSAVMERLEEIDPGLVLLDVWMPEMDGIDLLCRIKRARADLPVIVVSGHGNVETAVRATRLGACDFIEKPFSIEGLLVSVNRAFDEVGLGRGEAATKARGAVRPMNSEGPRHTQRTLGRSVVGGGLGLHSGIRTGVILHPLPPDSGIRFAGVGSDEYVEAHVDYVDSTGYATTLFKSGTVARTVEHLMATLHAYGVTNLLVKVEGEVPILDGSAVEFCKLVDSAGVEEQGTDLPLIVIQEPMRIDTGDGGFISIAPWPGFKVTYELSYPEPVGEQVFEFVLNGPASFVEQIAPARTFGFVDEIRALERAGLGQGGQLSNFILIGERGIVNTELRFPEELARHKILDILGDFYLLGAPLRGAIHARKTGHSNNIDLVRAIKERVGF